MTNARQRMLYGRTTSSLPSRFLEEIPEENMEWTGRQEQRSARSDWDEGGSWSDTDWGGDSFRTSAGTVRAASGRSDNWADSGPGGSWSSNGVHSYRAPARKETRPTAASAAKPKASAAPMLQLEHGDMVQHTAFGKGMVLSVRPMGGDALVQVVFDGVGEKKLMLKSAGAYMKKL